MKQFAILAAIIGVLVLFFIVDKHRTRKEMIQVMDSLYQAKKKIINYDSIESQIRRRVMDSVSIVLKGQEKRLNLMRSDIDRTHKANEERLCKYDSLIVSRPDF